MLTLNEYLMGRESQYPIDDDMRINALHLLSKVNELLEEFYKANPKAKKRIITSGYRPAAINAKIGGAKKSNHMLCLAVDLSDVDCLLSKWITVDILKKYDLYMENKVKTPTWVHLQLPAPKSGNRVFNP